MTPFTRRKGLLSALLLLAGCASGPDLRPRLKPVLAGRRLVVDASVLPTSVAYMTEGFLHAKEYSGDFGIAWEPNATAADRLSALLVADGHDATPMSALATPEQRRQWLMRTRSTLEPLTVGSAAWSAAFVDDARAKAEDLRRKGTTAELLVELFVVNLSAGDPVMMRARFTSTVAVRVSNIASGAVVFSGKYFAFEELQLDGMNVKARIEADNLKVLKEIVDGMLRMAPRVHYSPLDGAFSQGFIRQRPELW